MVYKPISPGVWGGGLDGPFAFKLGEGFGNTPAHACVVEKESAVAVDALPAGALKDVGEDEGRDVAAAYTALRLLHGICDDGRDLLVGDFKLLGDGVGEQLP